METTKYCVESVEKEQDGDTTEQQYEESNKNLVNGCYESDNKVFDFEAHFNGNGLCSADEYDDNDDGSLENSEFHRIRALEDEQESLLSSLMALTTHFAQVQFRLHQIVEAPEKERDILLKKLEDFADSGIPNWNEHSNEIEAKSILTKMDSQKNHQHELIEQLKTQLDDLEKYAYETGEPGVVPQAIMMEKQKIIIDELKQKMNLNFNELDLPQLSPDELRNQVDAAIGEFVSPLKMKEQLVAQLKTQVNDLERFIKFLQIEKNDKKKMLKMKLLKKHNCSDIDLHNRSCNCNFKDSSTSSSAIATNHRINGASSGGPSTDTFQSASTSIPQHLSFSSKLYQMFNKASTIFQIFALSQMGCASQNAKNFKRNTLKKTTRGNHWGDTRAKLEVDIQEILGLVIQINKIAANEEQLMMVRDKQVETEDDDVFVEAKTKIPTRKLSRYRSTSSSSSIIPPINSLTSSSKSDELKTLNVELITLVRKKFAVTLQKLFQHGLRSVNETRHLVPFFGCLSNIQTNGDHREYPEEDYTEMHAWELILEYYNLKNGDFYTETPAQKLSQSFNLDIVGEGLTSNKQTLLLAIRNITILHSPYKRSFNSHFKAFVCAGLNSRKLVQWLNLLFQCHELVTNYYTSWSYVAQTGFRDALKSIDQLSKYEVFDLPVDMAIRNLANIKDVFS